MTFGVATVLFILFNKKFIERPPASQSLSPDILNTEPMELCPLSPPSGPTPMDTSQLFIVDSMSEDESSSEEYIIKEKFY